MEQEKTLLEKVKESAAEYSSEIGKMLKSREGRRCLAIKNGSLLAAALVAYLGYNVVSDFGNATRWGRCYDKNRVREFFISEGRALRERDFSRMNLIYENYPFYYSTDSWLDESAKPYPLEYKIGMVRGTSEMRISCSWNLTIKDRAKHLLRAVAMPEDKEDIYEGGDVEFRAEYGRPWELVYLDDSEKIFPKDEIDNAVRLAKKTFDLDLRGYRIRVNVKKGE